MKFELTFDVLYKTQATCSIEADNLEEAKEIAQKIIAAYPFPTYNR